MKVCERCGKLLPEEEQKRCPACGAVQQAMVDAAYPGGDIEDIYSDRPLTSQKKHAPNDAKHDGLEPDVEDIFSDAPSEVTRHVPPRHAKPEFDEDEDGGDHTRVMPSHAHAEDGDTRHVPEHGREHEAEHARPRPGAVRRGAAKHRTGGTVSVRESDARLPRILGGIVLALVVLLVVASVATYFLYENFNAAKSFDALGKALLAQDVASLSEMVTTPEGAQPTEEQLQALCKLFTTQENVTTLQRQLNAQLKGEVADPQYPCLRPGEEAVFLGYSSYMLVAVPVSLRIPGGIAGQSHVLYLNGAPVTGQVTADGILYPDLFPGIYKAYLTAQSLLNETVTGTEADITLLRVDAPTDFDGALPLANITVGKCTSDAAEITVDGKPVTQKPVDGVVTLPSMRVGSTIGMTFTTDYGATTTASVQFVDMAATALEFGNHVTEGGVPDEGAINSVLSAWFASYLDARNNLDPARMTSCTDVVRGFLTAEITGEESTKHSFAFKTAAVDIATLLQSTYDVLPAIIVNATFDYTMTNREDFKVTDYTVFYTAEIVYQDGWKVNRVMPASKADYDSKTFATLPQ